MDNDIGFISANFVAKQSGYPGGTVDNWGEHDAKTRAESTVEDIADWMATVDEIGFDGVSLWTAHCWYLTAGPERIEAIRQIASDHGLDLYSYGGGFGVDPDGDKSPLLADLDDESDLPDGWRLTFEMADRLGCEWLSGGFDAATDSETVRTLIDRYDIGIAYENHPEGTVEEIVEPIEGLHPKIGVAFDTGWAATQGLDAPSTIREIGDDLKEVHLKDIESRSGHETCTLGEGIVDIQGCVEAMEEIGYDGWVTIEHEPFDRDPIPDVRESFDLVEDLLR